MKTGITNTKRNRKDTPTASLQAKGAVATAAKKAAKAHAIDKKEKVSKGTAPAGSTAPASLAPAPAPAVDHKAMNAEFAKLKKRIAGFGKRERTQRDNLHELLVDSTAFLRMYWNPSALTELVKELKGSRGRRLDDVMTWIWAATGGMSEGTGPDGEAAIYVYPKTSVLKFSQGDGKGGQAGAGEGELPEVKFGFSVKKISQDEKNLHGDKAQAMREANFDKCFAVMRTTPFWTFTPERVPSGFKFSSVWSVLRKAYKNLDSFAGTKEGEFFRELLRVADTYGLKPEIEKD